MSDIYLDNGNIGISGGDIYVCDDEIDIIQQAIHNMKLTVGGDIFHPERGNASIGDRRKFTDTYIDTIEEGCTQAILQDDRVKSVDDMQVELLEDNKYNYTVIFTITTIFDDQLNSTAII